MIVFSFSVQRKNESVVECRTLELTSSRFRHRLAAETRHKSHDGNLLPSLYLCFLLSGTGCQNRHAVFYLFFYRIKHAQLF